LGLGGLFPFVLGAHIVLAVSLFLPTILLPFALRLRGGKFEERPGRFTRALFWLQRNGSLAVAAGLAGTGIALVMALGTQLLGQPWLLIALVLYAANLVIAFVLQRPGLARLLRLDPGESEQERRRWKDRARRQRYFSYVMAGLIGVIGFLMSTKPQF
jgi:hypothetical protein